jgi:peptidyl-prolyl cis-trans isomerase SurA
MNKFALVLFSLSLGLPLLAQQAPTSSPSAAAPPAQTPAQAPSDETVVEEIVARINNNIVTRADLRRSQEQLVTEMHQQEPNATDSQIKEHEKDLLRDLIDQQLLVQKGEEMNISADTEVVKRLDEIRKSMKAESMEDVEKAAVAQGVSFEEFKQNLKNGIITQRVIGEEVGGHISVTAQEIQQFYDEHKAEMERPEQVRLSEILISTQPAPPVKDAKGDPAIPATPSADIVAQAEAKAQDIYQKLQNGGNFADLAKQYSQGPTSAVGGDLEYFRRGTLSKELEVQAFSMKVGEYTKPVRVNQGWMIMQVTEHQQAGIPPLKDVEGQIHQQIYMSKMQPALREYLTKLREDAYIDIKPGYIDTGASPNETKPVFTTAAAENAKALKKKKKFGIF